MTDTKRRLSLQGTIILGGDKSLSHRAVMFAAIADGTSTIRGLSTGADVTTTCNLFRALGVEIAADQSDSSITVVGRGISGLTSPAADLDCGNSGTTMRLCSGILAGSKVTARLVGDNSLMRRPMLRIVEPLRQMGARIEALGSNGTAPLLIEGAQLHAINYRSPVASAQVKSAILLAGLTADGPTSVTEPEKSRDHTERFLRALGCEITEDQMRVTVEPCARLRAFDYTVAADTSTAVIFAVAGLLVAGSSVRLERVLLNPTRTGGFDFLQRMGAGLAFENRAEEHNEPVGDVIVRASDLVAADSDGIQTASMIDEIPILAVAAALADGVSRFRNIAELRVKESDRIAGTIEMLKAYNISAETSGDDLFVHGGEIRKISEATHHGDHRLAMAIEVLNLVAEGELAGGYGDAISVSAPEFYSQLRKALR